jgi:hypothetical protein
VAYDKTEVAVSKSQDAIRKLVYSHKGTGLMLISRTPHEGFEAFMELDKLSYHIRVMAVCKDQKHDRHGMLRSNSALSNAVEQENRRVWRVLYWHLKAMFEAADSGVIDIRDVIMPYVVLADGSTLSEHVKPRMKQLMTMDTSRLLGGGSV